MTKFITRVELHGAQSDDYDTLHTEMEEQGFTKTIIDNKSGEEFNLPEAEYNIERNYNKQQILDKAKTAAEETVLECSILVTKSGGRIWHNL